MIEIDKLTVRLAESDVLSNARLGAQRGELIAVLGANGAGKTTLLKAIAGLLTFEGTLKLDGRDASSLSLQARARMVAYLPQGHAAHWPISVRDAVAIGRMPHGATAMHMRPADREAIEQAMANCDVAHLDRRAVTELSSGERARVMLARALAVQAAVLLADEPVASLDPAHQLAVLELLARTAKRGTVVLAVLHDLTLAARFANRAIVLAAGRIVADGPPAAVLTKELLAEAFAIDALHLAHESIPVLVPWSPRADLRR